MMVEEGVLENPKVDVIFGLHISADTDVGKIRYKEGGAMAAVDPFKIVIKGKQAHGAYPWLSVDPITTAAQIIMGLQTIVSREIKLIDEAAVVTIGSIHGGNRSNIIPSEVELVGTIRTLNKAARFGQEGVITKPGSPVAMVIPTNEEWVIAEDAMKLVTAK